MTKIDSLAVAPKKTCVETTKDTALKAFQNGSIMLQRTTLDKKCKIKIDTLILNPHN